MHGLIGTLQVPDLPGRFPAGTALAPDLPGYGSLRDAPPDEIDLGSHVAHLGEAIEAAFGREAVHLVGHSVGGVVAALFARAFPRRVRGLVSVEGNFTPKDAFWSAAVARMSSEEAERMLAGFRADPAGWLADSGIPADHRTLETGGRWLAWQPASTIRAMARSVVEETGRPGYLADLRAVFARHPVHLVAGSRSRDGWDVPDWALREAAGSTVLPDRGHLMMIEDPEGFAAAIGEIVGSV